MKRFALFYFMKAEPQRIGEVVREHVGYWKDLSLPDYMGGPFADRSGGLISFSAQDLGAATKIVERDPFERSGLIEQKWLKEWVIE